MNELFLAHGVGQVYESPIPLPLYYLAAAATVGVSFLIRSLSKTAPRGLRERRIGGPGAARVLRVALRAFGVIGLTLTVLTGILARDEGFTFTTLYFWVAFVVGVTVLSAILEGTWEAADPWDAIEHVYRIEDAEVTPREAPWWLGPVALYVLFWFELISGWGFIDFWIVIFLLAYSLYYFSYRLSFGESWRRADPFSILFGFAGMFAPLRLGSDGIYSRNPVARLDRPEPMPRALHWSVFVLLGATTIDNLTETVGWYSFLRSVGLDRLTGTLVESVALALMPLFFLLPFLGAIRLARSWLRTKESFDVVARSFTWSLVPIGIAYVLAHNAPLLLAGIPRLIQLAGDPFALGWNVLGLRGAFPGYVPSPALVWWVEIAIIVGGHILGVLTAHRVALRLEESGGSAAKSQYVLTALMVVFTIATLWLLAQPLVA